MRIDVLDFAQNGNSTTDDENDSSKVDFNVLKS